MQFAHKIIIKVWKYDLAPYFAHQIRRATN